MSTAPASPPSSSTTSAVSSSPQKASAKRVSSDNLTEEARRARELRDELRYELEDHVVGATLDDVTEMLLPLWADDTFKQKREACIDELHKEGALPCFEPFLGKEQDCYSTLAKSLNEYVEQAFTALGGEDFDKLATKLSHTNTSWLKWARYYPYDRPTWDQVRESPALKPDLVALDEKVDPKTYFRAAWCKRPPAGHEVHQIQHAVEVKDDWTELLWHAATYAHAGIAATPLRQAEIVLGVNQKTAEFCVFLFHSGGITASHPVCMSNESVEDRKSILRYFITVLSWRTAEDALYPPFTDGSSFKLPPDVGDSASAALDVVHTATIFSAISVRGRRTLVIRAKREADREPSSTTPQAETNSRDAAGIQARRAHGKQAPSSAEDTPGPRRSDRLANSAAKTPSASVASTNHSRTRSTLPTVAETMDAQTTAAAASTTSPDVPPDMPISSSSLQAPLASKAPGPSSEAASPSSSAPVPPSEPRLHPVRFLKLPKEKARLSHEQPKPDDWVRALRLARIENPVIKFSHPEITRANMEPRVLRATSGKFGCIRFLYAWFPTDRKGRRLGTERFTPAEQARWGKLPQGTLQKRVMSIVVFLDCGLSLDTCKDVKRLRRALAHIALGICTVYLHGFQHRDITIGNTYFLDQPLDTAPFSVFDRVVYLAGLEGLEGMETAASQPKCTWNALYARYANDPAGREVVELAQHLEDTAHSLGLGQCIAVIADYDLSAELDSYFQERELKGEISGTREFMSEEITNAFKTGRPYRHTPLDDGWSLFYTAIWATVFGCESPTEDDRLLWAELKSNDAREAAVNKTVRPFATSRFSNRVLEMAPVLRKLKSRLDTIGDKYYELRVNPPLDSRELALLSHSLMFEVTQASIEILLKD